MRGIVYVGNVQRKVEYAADRQPLAVEAQTKDLLRQPSGRVGAARQGDQYPAEIEPIRTEKNPERTIGSGCGGSDNTTRRFDQGFDLRPRDRLKNLKWEPDRQGREGRSWLSRYNQPTRC